MIFSILGLLLGAALLLVGGEFVVRAASRLALALRLSPLFIGLTVVSLGTSAPELAVSVMTARQGLADITLGNVVGSNLFNLLVIVGFSALAAPLAVGRQVVRFDVPVMILACVTMYGICRDGTITATDGLLLLGMLVAYFTISFWLGRKQFQHDKDSISGVESKSIADQSVTLEPDLPGVAELDLDPSKVGGLFSAVRDLLLLAVGIGLLVGGCDVFVDAAVAVAQVIGLSEAVIGLTIVSAGTSLPELVTSFVASIKGQRSIAVGNAVGSTTLNILAVLGVTSLVASGGLGVAQSLLSSDIPLMIGASVLSLVVFATHREVSRREGVVLVTLYCVYVAVLITMMDSGDVDAVVEMAPSIGVS